jgi:hypothetical protein
VYHKHVMYTIKRYQRYERTWWRCVSQTRHVH